MKFSKILLLFAATFIFKFGLILYFTYLLSCQSTYLIQGQMTAFAGDTYSYTGAIDNLVDEGTYFFWNGKRKVLAGRLPHYGVPYFFFRTVFDKPLAGDLYVILQILVDTAAVLFFAFLCFELFGRRSAFWIGYALYLLSFNFSVQAQYLSPESLSLSFFIIFLYFFHRYWKKAEWKDCLLSSIFLALAVVLKPYLLLVYVPFFLTVLKKENVLKDKKIVPFLKKSAILGLPLILLLLPWIVRNAVVLHRFVPAQENVTAGYDYTEADFAYRRFVASWGGNMIFWDPQAVGCYFEPKPKIKCDFKFPEYALINESTLSEIENVREDYIRLQKQYDPDLEKIVVEKFDRLTNTYRSEKPFLYYIGSKFLSAKNMFWHTNNNNLPINSAFRCYKSYQLFFKLVQFAIYLSAMTVGLVGLIILGYKKYISWTFLFVPIYLVGFFSLNGWAEARYFNHAYPIMLLGLTFILYRLFEVFRKWFVGN